MSNNLGCILVKLMYVDLHKFYIKHISTTVVFFFFLNVNYVPLKPISKVLKKFSFIFRKLTQFFMDMLFSYNYVNFE